MPVIAIRVCSKGGPFARLFPTRKDARNTGNGYTICDSPTDIVGTRWLLDSALQEIAKLPGGTREECAARIAASLGWSDTPTDQVLPEQPTTHEEVQMSETAAKTATRVSKYAGATLHPSEGVVANGNPRKPGSHGHKSLQIIIDNPGISYAAFCEAGGRANDLKWDADKGNVVVKSPS